MVRPSGLGGCCPENRRRFTISAVRMGLRFKRGGWPDGRNRGTGRESLAYRPLRKQAGSSRLRIDEIVMFY